MITNRWKRRLSGAVVYTMVVAVGALALFLNEQQEADRCEAQKENREVLTQVVLLATDGESSTDLTSVPGFEDLDEATQIFLRNLAVASEAQDRPTSARARLLAAIPPIEC